MVAARFRVHSQVSAALTESAARMKRQADGRRRASSFIVGDKVWLSTQHLPLRHGSRKLAARWAGPFRIAAEVSAEAWRLELPGQWRIHPVFHSSQLKAVHGQPRAPQPIALEDGDGAVEFEVERILDRRHSRGGREEFLVRWKGYGAHEDTWEPASNLANASAAVQAFLDRV